MTSWNEQLRDQFGWHWTHQIRPRLAGLTDDEYFWEPAADTWSVRPRGTSTAPMAAGSGDFTIDFAFPEPDPAPLTTIAWQLGHVIVGCLAMRNASHFGGPSATYESWSYAGTADAALAQLDQEVDTWLAGVAALDDEQLDAPCGPAEGPYADYPMSTLVLHINRELIHHLSEVSLLRDLYLHTHRKDR